MTQNTPFVYIIESPSPEDIYDGRTEGHGLCEMLRLGGLPFQYRQTSNLEQFRRALSMAPDGALIDHYNKTGQVPVLHFSLHGNKDGVGLTNGEVVPWNALYEMLSPINSALGGRLLVCLSSCHGYAAIKMSMHEGVPIGAIVSYSDDLDWDVGLLGFSTFYFNWFKNVPVDLALQRMRFATGDNRFVAEAGVETQRSFMAFLRERDEKQEPLIQGLLAECLQRNRDPE